MSRKSKYKGGNRKPNFTETTFIRKFNNVKNIFVLQKALITKFNSKFIPLDNFCDQQHLHTNSKDDFVPKLDLNARFKES